MLYANWKVYSRLAEGESAMPDWIVSLQHTSRRRSPVVKLNPMAEDPLLVLLPLAAGPSYLNDNDVPEELTESILMLCFSPFHAIVRTQLFSHPGVNLNMCMPSSNCQDWRRRTLPPGSETETLTLSRPGIITRITASLVTGFGTF